jgi:hypothetical protein
MSQKYRGFACHKHFHCTAGAGVFMFVRVAFSSFPPFTLTRSAGKWLVNDCGTVVAHCIGGVEGGKYRFDIY